jgi:RHS repeat-associated protein
VYGKQIDEILMRTDPSVNGGAAFYCQQDHEGSVTQLTNAAGTLIESYRYDAFGAPVIKNAQGTIIGTTAYNNRFLFTGREYTVAFGFYEYRARAYHPDLGRFMSEDPKLFDAGDYNLYRYVHNDPLDLTDPMGLRETMDEHQMSSTEYVWALAKWFDRSNLVQGNFTGTLTSSQIDQKAQGGLVYAQLDVVAKSRAPSVSAGLINEGMTATDVSVDMMRRTNVPYSVVSYTDSSGNQRFTRPQSGTDKVVIQGREIWMERARIPEDALAARIVGHSHKSGDAAFSSGRHSDMDTGRRIPVMKNRDAHPGLYDMYYKGWRYDVNQYGHITGTAPYSGN